MRLRLLEPWRTRLLWLSVGLNLFAVAMLCAPLVWHRRPQGPPGFDMIIDHMARHLPAADAARFRQSMARERPWYDMDRARLNEARQDAAKAVGREPFDGPAVRAALQAMQDRLRDSALRFDESLVVALADLSPAARASMVENFRRGRR